MLRNDAAWAHDAYPPDEAWSGFLACQKVARFLLQTLAPGAVLLWNSTHPQTAIFQMEGWRAGLPVYALERGLLPDTLMVDSWGIQGASDCLRHWLAHDLALREDVRQIWESASHYYLTHRPQKYAQAAFGGGGNELRRQLGLENRQVVLLFGQGDAAGLFPREARAMRQNAPVFAGTRHCLAALKNAVAQIPSAVLLFKPHPLDAASYADVVGDSVICVNGFNVHALMDMADVVAAQFTTLQYETVFYDKPVLLLGRSAWWGRGCTYEVNRMEELLPALRAALAREGWNHRRERAQQFLAWALSEYLIACHPEAPARHDLEDLADFLQRASWDSWQLAPVEVRLWQALEQLAQWAEHPHRNDTARKASHLSL
ncbi:hypothetical protein NXS98_10625 [Fontisphaera persica]|uniref:hypothetical protein n=1 Tax=Fontisphaera persica TaxID=2974023 RepID=UPI0024C0BD2D|nr:hypothetical protein [Fontisphaera persica]WCJ58179.1 hypothetical protein NXS98_10625 [Fontisphaera persica]